MFQDILTYFTIFTATGITVYNTYRLIGKRRGNVHKSACGGCSSCDLKSNLTAVKNITGENKSYYSLNL